MAKQQKAPGKLHELSGKHCDRLRRLKPSENPILRDLTRTSKNGQGYMSRSGYKSLILIERERLVSH